MNCHRTHLPQASRSNQYPSSRSGIGFRSAATMSKPMVATCFFILSLSNNYAAWLQLFPNGITETTPQGAKPLCPLGFEVSLLLLRSILFELGQRLLNHR